MPDGRGERNIKTLILSCNTGEGHNSCAKAIKESYEARGIVCDICDALSFISPGVSRFISKGHIFVYRHIPGLFRWGYRFSEKHEELFEDGSKTYKLMASGADKLHDFIEENGYDTVICPHVFSALMLTELLKKYPGSVRSCFVGTDYTCSPGTAESRLDLYFMPDVSVMRPYTRGIDPSRVVESGIPVRQTFYESRSRAEAKHLAGIPEDSEHLLVMCGSMGCGPMKKLTAMLADKLTAKQYMTVVCGTNHPLKSWLEFKYSGRENIRVMGFMENISLLMDSADLYLTKPGGISTSEAAIKALPMVLVDAVSGCERYNGDYFLKAGLAVTAESPAKLSELCAELLSNPLRREAMRASGLRRERYNAAELIYDYMKNDLYEAKEG